jgi:hypothetical protein
MAGVTVTFARDTALVRTVRLIAAAVARRAGRDEDFVEEVRLAVGEACGLLAAVVPADPADADPVLVRLSLDSTFTVVVRAADAALPHDLDLGPLDPWTLLRGLVGDFDVRREGGALELRMRWPTL